MLLNPYRKQYASAGTRSSYESPARGPEPPSIPASSPYAALSSPTFLTDAARLLQRKFPPSVPSSRRSCPDEQDLPSAVAELLHPDYAGPYEAEIDATLLDPTAASTQAYRFDHQRHPTTGTASDPVPVQADGGGHASAHDKGRVSPAAGGDTESERDDETGAGVETGNGLDAGAGTRAGTGTGTGTEAGTGAGAGTGTRGRPRTKARAKTLNAGANKSGSERRTTFQDSTSVEPGHSKATAGFILIPFDEIADNTSVTCETIENQQYLSCNEVVASCMLRITKTDQKPSNVSKKFGKIEEEYRGQFGKLKAIRLAGKFNTPGILFQNLPLLVSAIVREHYAGCIPAIANIMRTHFKGDLAFIPKIPQQCHTQTSIELFGVRIKCALIDYIVYLSVYDSIMAITEKDQHDSTETWRKLGTEKREQLAIYLKTFTFFSASKPHTPVITFKGVLNLCMILGGNRATAKRMYMIEKMEAFLAGDEDLVAELRMNARSNHPLSKLARVSRSYEQASLDGDTNAISSEAASFFSDNCDTQPVLEKNARAVPLEDAVKQTTHNAGFKPNKTDYADVSNDPVCRDISYEERRICIAERKRAMTYSDLKTLDDLKAWDKFATERFPGDMDIQAAIKQRIVKVARGDPDI